MDSIKEVTFNNFLLKSWLREIGSLQRCEYLRKLKRNLTCLGLPRTRVRQCLLQLLTEPQVALQKTSIKNYRYHKEKQKKCKANLTEVGEGNGQSTQEDQCAPTGETLVRASDKDDEKQRKSSASKKLDENHEKSTSISMKTTQKTIALLESHGFDTELAKLDEVMIKTKKQGSAERTLVKKLSSSAPTVAVPSKKMTNDKKEISADKDINHSNVTHEFVKKQNRDFTDSDDSMDSYRKKKIAKTQTPELIADKVGFDILKTTVSGNQNRIKINLNMFSQRQQSNTATDINISGISSEDNSMVDFKHAGNKIQIATEKISVDITTTSVDFPKQQDIDQEPKLTKESKQMKRFSSDISSENYPSKKSKMTLLRTQVVDAESELQYLYQRRRKLRRLLRHCFGECLTLSEEEDERNALRRDRKRKRDSVKFDHTEKFSLKENLPTSTSIKAITETDNLVDLPTQKAFSNNSEICSTSISESDDHNYSIHTKNSEYTPDTEISPNDNSNTADNRVKVTDISLPVEDSNAVPTEYTLVQNAESTTEDYSDAETIELDYSTRPERIESLAFVNITSKCSEENDDDEYAVSSSQDAEVKDPLCDASDEPLQENLLELLQMEMPKSYEIISNGNVLSIVERRPKDMNQNILEERDKVCQDKSHRNVSVEDKNSEKSMADKDESLNREIKTTGLKDMPILEDVSAIEIKSKNTQSTVVSEGAGEPEKQCSQTTDSSINESSDKAVYGKLRVRTSAELGSRWCPTPLHNPAPDISEQVPTILTELLPSIIDNINSNPNSDLTITAVPFNHSLSTPQSSNPQKPTIKTKIRPAKSRIAKSGSSTNAKQSKCNKQTEKSCRSTSSNASQVSSQLEEFLTFNKLSNDNPVPITTQPNLYRPVDRNTVPNTTVNERHAVSEASPTAPRNNLTDTRLHQYSIPPVHTVAQKESSNTALPRQISEQQKQSQQFVPPRRVLITQSQQRQPNKTNINNLYKYVLANQQHQRSVAVPSNDLGQSDVIIESEHLYGQSRTYPPNPPVTLNHNSQVPQVGQRVLINYTVPQPVIPANLQYLTSTSIPVLNTPAQHTAFPHVTNLPRTRPNLSVPNANGVGTPISYVAIHPNMNTTVAHHQIPAVNQQTFTANQVLVHPNYMVQRGNVWYRNLPQSELQRNVQQPVIVMRPQLSPNMPGQQVPMHGIQNTVHRGEYMQSTAVIQNNNVANRPVEGLQNSEHMYEDITPPPPYPVQSMPSSVTTEPHNSSLSQPQVVANTEKKFHVLKFLNTQQKLLLLTQLEQYLMNCFSLYSYMSKEEWNLAQVTRNLLMKLKCVLNEDLQKDIRENWSSKGVPKEKSIFTNPQSNAGNNNSEEKSREELTVLTGNENRVSCNTTDANSQQDTITKEQDTVIVIEDKTKQVVDNRIPVQDKETVTTSIPNNNLSSSSIPSENEKSQKQPIDFSISQPSKEEIEMLRAMYEEDREAKSVIVYHSSKKSSDNNCNTISPLTVATENVVKSPVIHNMGASKDLPENTNSVSSKILEATATEESEESSVKSVVDDKASDQDEIISNTNKNLSEQNNLETSEILEETIEKVEENSMKSLVTNNEIIEHGKVPETSKGLSEDPNSDSSKNSEEETTDKSEERSLKSLMINDETTQNITQDETVPDTSKDLSEDKNSDLIKILEEARTEEFHEKSIHSHLVNAEATEQDEIVSEMSKDLPEVDNYNANEISEEEATTEEFEEKCMQSPLVYDEATDQNESLSETSKDLFEVEDFDADKILKEEVTIEEFEEKFIQCPLVNDEATDRNESISETSKDLFEIENFDANKILKEESTIDDPADNSNERILNSAIVEEHCKIPCADEKSDNSSETFSQQNGEEMVENDSSKIISSNVSESISPNSRETMMDTDRDAIIDIKHTVKNSDSLDEETDSQDTIRNSPILRKAASDFEELNMDDTDTIDVELSEQNNDTKTRADIDEVTSVSSSSTFHADIIEESLDTDRLTIVSISSGSDVYTKEMLVESYEDDIDINREIYKYNNTSDGFEFRPSLSVSPPKLDDIEDRDTIVEKEMEIIEIDEEENFENNYEINREDSPLPEMFIADVKSISVSAFQSLNNTENAMNVEGEVLMEEYDESLSQKNINDNNDDHDKNLKLRCLHCGKESTVICERCKRAAYCSKVCSDLNWTAHYRECNPSI